MSPSSPDRRLPFTLLGGYLGAGKTTLLNALLSASAGERIAVLVNDVGAVNVDAALIAEHRGETLTLTNGCVCCAIADDFTLTLETVRSLDPPPDRVVMELSGVAEPARLVPWANTTGFRLDGIVVAVDAEQFGEQVGRRFVADAVDAQVRAADLIVITKSDLVAADRLEAVRGLIAGRSNAPVIEATFGAAPLGALFGLERSGHDEPEGGPAAPVTTRTIDIVGCGREELDALLADLPPNVVRAKGLVAVDGEVVEVHAVGPRRTVRRRADLDDAAADGRLVVIELPTD